MEGQMILHPQLQHDCAILGNLPLCTVLLLKDAHYPWLILVPQRENISEIHDLPEVDQQQLMRESCFLSQTLKSIFHADKINVAALGNMVPQLHVHHIVRYRDDVAWPAPVWGAYPALTYGFDALNERCQILRDALSLQPMHGFVRNNTTG